MTSQWLPQLHSGQWVQVPSARVFGPSSVAGSSIFMFDPETSGNFSSAKLYHRQPAFSPMP
jgi:hypothetical protein